MVHTGAGDETAKVWSFTAGVCLKTFAGHGDDVRSGVAREGAGLMKISQPDSAAPPFNSFKCRDNPAVQHKGLQPTPCTHGENWHFCHMPHDRHEANTGAKHRGEHPAYSKTRGCRLPGLRAGLLLCQQQ